MKILPNKVLEVSVSSAIGVSYWDYDDGTGDPWWQGGTSPRPYRWEITFSVVEQTHGSHLTREPFRYNGLDINPGNWISDTVTGLAVKIDQVLEKTETYVRAVVEDVDRYNTFLNSFGAGIFTVPTQAVVFEIGDDDLPILQPLPPTVTTVSFVPQIEGRFRTNNPLYKYRVYQPNHTLNVNDVVWVNPVTKLFEVVTLSSMARMVGTVVQVGPGDDVFYFSPTTRVVENIDPPLPGNAGDYVFVDTDGDLTTDSSTGKVAYIKLTDNIPDRIIGTVDDPIVSSGSVMQINNHNVAVSGTLSNVISQINALTSSHNVTAYADPGDVSVSTNNTELFYGIVASLGNTTQITINSQPVTFNITTRGTVHFGTTAADSVDMAKSINNANIPNIVADGGMGGPSGKLTITNTAGGPINIVNLVNDGTGASFAGPASCTGLELLTAASTVEYLKLENPLGNGIIIKNITNDPVGQIGITSVRNGRLPLGLVVEQAIAMSGGIMIYPDLASRPIAPSGIQQAMVLDNGNGEWALYLWDGSAWTQIANKDSAASDANTLVITVNHDSTSPVFIGSLSNGSRISLVTVEILEDFDGTVSYFGIGDDLDNFRIISDTMVDFGEVGVYSVQSSTVYDVGTDTEIYCYFEIVGATKGSMKIALSYQ